MQPDEFRALVARMREAQRTFFRTRDQAALRESKRLEGLVDAALAPAPATSIEQRTLFDGGRDA